MPQIHHVNGVPYLVEKCGCGDSKFYKLSEAVVSLGSDGKTIVDDEGTGGVTWGDIATPLEDCYAQSAVEWILLKTSNFYGTMLDVITVGVDALTPLDELLDIVGLGASILSGSNDFERWAENASGNVSGALVDTEYVDTMVANWDYLGPVTRGELLDWVNTSPMYHNGVHVRYLLREWVKYALMFKVNEEFQRLAAACEGGVEYNPGGQIYYPGDIQPLTIDYLGTTYPYQIHYLDEPLLDDGAWWYLSSAHEADAEAVIAIAYWVQTPDDICTMRLYGGNAWRDFGSFASAGIAAGEPFAYQLDKDATYSGVCDLILQTLGMTAHGEWPAPISPKDIRTGIANDSGGTMDARLTHIITVGAGY